MTDIRPIGNSKLSIIQDPFNKVSIKDITVCYRKHTFEDKFVSEGRVEFQNGQTSAIQRFKGEDFDSVVLQIKAFIETLN